MKKQLSETSYYVFYVGERFAARWGGGRTSGWYWRIIEHNGAEELEDYEERVFDLHGPFAARQQCLDDLSQTWPDSVGNVP